MAKNTGSRCSIKGWNIALLPSSRYATMSPTCPLANRIGMPRKTRFLSGISHTGWPKAVRPQDAMGKGKHWDFQENDIKAIYYT